MLDAVTIRPAVPADRPALEECMAELQAFERTIEANRVAPEAIRGRYIDGLLADCEKNQGVILVAEAGGHIVGFVCVLARVTSSDIIEKDREYAYVTDLVVLEPYRRSGVGTDLMKTAEAHVISCGANRIHVGVLAANAGAHALYRKLGYSDSLISLEKKLQSP